MAGAEVSKALRNAVRERAKGRCEYCLTAEALSGIRGQIDHILPRSRGGTTTMDNLCLACAACNGYKHARTQAIDPETGAEVSLFDPRQQQWREHFAWSADGTEIHRADGDWPCDYRRAPAQRCYSSSVPALSGQE